MTHVDIVGPPGAGKSTLSKTLIQSTSFAPDNYIYELSFQKTPASEPLWSHIIPRSTRSVIGRLYWRHLFRDIYLDHFQEQYHEAYETFQIAGKIDARSHYPEMYEKAAAKLACLRALSDKSYIIDESLTQLAAEVLNFGQELGNKYLSVIPVPDVLIVVTCPPEICLERQYARDKPVASSLDFDEQTQAIDRLNMYQSQFSTIAHQLERRGAQVVTVNSYKNNPNACAEQALSRIDSFAMDE